MIPILIINIPNFHTNQELTVIECHWPKLHFNRWGLGHLSLLSNLTHYEPQGEPRYKVSLPYFSDKRKWKTDSVTWITVAI